MREHKSFKLTEEQVLAIYRRKADHTRDCARLLGLQYGVTCKTIRDIWHEKTWTSVTLHTREQTAPAMPDLSTPPPLQAEQVQAGAECVDVQLQHDEEGWDAITAMVILDTAEMLRLFSP